MLRGSRAPSNASWDPVKEKHAPRSSFGGVQTSHVPACEALRFYRPGLAAISSPWGISVWGVGIFNLARMVTFSGVGMPEAEQTVYYSAMFALARRVTFLETGCQQRSRNLSGTRVWGGKL